MATDTILTKEDEAALRSAHTQVVLACLKRTLGEDNVDLYSDDAFRIGVTLPPEGNQFFTVIVVERDLQQP